MHRLSLPMTSTTPFPEVHLRQTLWQTAITQPHRAPVGGGDISLGALGLLRVHRAYLRPIGRQGVHLYLFPVPPAHPRVTKCDTARENLLGIIGDLVEVSLALEENIVPEYLTSRTFEICSYLLSRIYIWNFLFLFGLVRNRLPVSEKSGDLTIGY